MIRTPLRRRNKFRARRTEYRGAVYASALEAGYAGVLDSMRKAADPAERVTGVERQVRVPLVVNGILIADYYCDFVVTRADGSVTYEETKGFATPTWAMKERLFRALYPERVLRVLRANGSGLYAEVPARYGRKVRENGKPAYGQRRRSQRG